MRCSEGSVHRIRREKEWRALCHLISPSFLAVQSVRLTNFPTLFHLDFSVSFRVALENAEAEILRLGVVRPWSSVFAGFYGANLCGCKVREMNEAGLAMRVPPWTTRGGCGFSVMCQVQSPCSNFLWSRVERMSDATNGLSGKEHYQRCVMFDRARNSWCYTVSSLWPETGPLPVTTGSDANRTWLVELLS